MDSGWDDLFDPGRNCWRIETARRATIRHESSEYFDALREACGKAKNTILVVGWDFDRNERMGREDTAPTFEEFFTGLLEGNESLEVWLLSWDFSFIYAREREWFQGERLQYFGHERFQAWFDGAHPATASQHQKFVVIDDETAFVGGIDLSRWRWDTAEHAPNDRRRTNPDGERYQPFHDLMLQLEGAPARALGELARQRWAASGSDRKPPALQSAEEPPAGETRPEPETGSPPLSWCDLEVALARTWPAYADREEVREVEQLYFDSFRRARDYIYIENQYLTSRSLCAALAERLREEEGPDLIIVLPRVTGGWLEQVSMGELRRRRVAELREADRHDRLRLFYAYQPGLPEDECIMVHAKVMIADDCFLRIGSANTSNRSMGLDSECDAAIVDQRHGAARALLHELLAEHLDVPASRVEQAREETSGLIEAVERLTTADGRSLRILERPEEPRAVALEEEEILVDPEEPIDAAALMQRSIPDASKDEGHRRVYLFLGFVVALLALGAAWRWTPLGEWANPDRLAEGLALLDSPVSRFLAAVGVITATALLMMPLTVLVVAAALLLGAWQGFAASMTGAILSAAVAFLIGERTGGRILERYGESRVHQISERLADRGIIAVAVLRLMPVAPYTVVNVVAGASHLKLHKFLIGSALGLLPGMAALTFFSGSLMQAVREPSAMTWAGLGAVVLLILGGGWLLRHMLSERQSKEPNPDRLD
ncbi:MAG: VTT domain-containing protein [Xanthomonadales bacterium]|jgi:phosphatidylserine/phosphatidylglycerophosphate/cardiolipin synthase-like enzyme/uncharacterized membrane protein YdjX (TVP38/TMEM64 family)|nr:VTT domain-containing protein [Xanthomonadales bacterium]